MKNATSSRSRFAQNVNLRLSPEAVARLDELALNDGTTRAHHIRVAVRNYLDEAASDAAFLADIQTRAAVAG